MIGALSAGGREASMTAARIFSVGQGPAEGCGSSRVIGVSAVAQRTVRPVVDLDGREYLLSL